MWFEESLISLLWLSPQCSLDIEINGTHIYLKKCWNGTISIDILLLQLWFSDLIYTHHYSILIRPNWKLSEKPACFDIQTNILSQYSGLSVGWPKMSGTKILRSTLSPTFKLQLDKNFKAYVLKSGETVKEISVVRLNKFHLTWYE